jgi:3',5'-cyclic-AMP phosphodiesterase
MKKILLIIFLFIFLAVGGFFFLKAKNSKILPSQTDIGNNFNQNSLNSLQGSVDFKSEDPAVQPNNENVPDRGSPFEKTNQELQAKPDTSGRDSILTFAVLGDTQRFDAGNSQGNFQKAAAEISKLNPDLVVAVGDLIGGCEGKSSDAKDYADWKKIIGPLAAKTYAVQGNHDRVSDGGSCDKIWQDAFNFPTNGPSGFSELTYSLDLKNAHFVFLDSIKPDGHQINDTQRTWLDQDLAKNKMEDTFVIFHEPAFPVSSKIGESLDTQASQRNALWQILDKYNVTAVLNGHEHIVSRRKVDSKVFPEAKNLIYQLVFANTDSFNHDLPKPGIAEYASQVQGSFGFVKVNGKDITVETHGPDGKTLDTHTFSK